MYKLVNVQFRCQQHEAFQSGCESCRFLKQWEAAFDDLADRRRQLVLKLRDQLRSEKIIMIDMR
ncbi:MAG TPA: hypothetical protein VFA15_05475 [Nitrososphaera sp.]|nr:hypothetical protein [Nitrososphaera sp.]